MKYCLFYVFTFALLYILSFSSIAHASALSTTAAALAPGQWALVPGTNAGLLSTRWAAGTHGYDDGNMGWDSTRRKIIHTSAEHGPYNQSGFICGYWPTPGIDAWPDPGGTCYKPLMFFDDATDTWSISAYGSANHTELQGGHGYDNVAWDDTHQVLYIHEYNDIHFRRYCVSNTTPAWCVGKGGTWSNLPNLANFQTIGAIAYHATLNGGVLLAYGGDRGGSSGCGALFAFSETTGLWTTQDAGTLCKFNTGDYNNLLEYSPVKQVAIFGGGGGNQDSAHAKRLWKIDSSGVITAMPPSPWPINFAETDTRTALADPVSGDFIFIFGHSSDFGVSTASVELWRLNPTGSGTWTLIDNNLKAVGKPCNTDLERPCPNDLFGTAISTYGVLLYWKITGASTAEVWMYKVTASGGGDVTAPTVSITAPAPAATVSGSAVTLSATAADNVGVVGVQFKIDGVATGAEDLTSPYSISWNSTTASNGSHTITATARDAVGNSTTSTGVAVTVSNAAVTADFNTRCTAPGVIRCRGFDSAADIANSLDGSNSALSLDGTAQGVLDSTIKASGNSSLKLTIPQSSGPNNSGNYWINFSDDLRTVFPCHGESYAGTTCVQAGTGNDYYVQFRARFDPYYITNQYSGGGWKLAWVGNVGDHPGCSTSNTTNCFASCTDLELVMQNTNHYNVGPLGYYACPGHNYQTDFYTLNVPNPGDINLQNAMPSPYCLYPPSTAKGCFGWFPNEWMTFQAHIHVDNPRTFVDAACGGVLCRDYPSSYIEVWAAREGQPSQLVTTKSFPIWAGTNASDQRYGKVWLTAYESGRIPGGADATQASAVWFDELIISTVKIADPSSTPDTTIPTVVITSPIPPTTSTTTSPIAVSGTAIDNVSVTSVTWTCPQCVTTSGTATSSPGTSISWSIPTLNLVAGTNVVNVVSHDAAGNASTAATLTITYTPNTTYWVRPTGTMSGCTASGTAPTTDAGYKSTITAGVNCMAAGNRLIIRAGTYNERLDEEAGGITYPRATSWAGASIIEALAGEIVTLLPQTANGNAVIRTTSTGTNYFLWFMGHNRNFIIDGTNVNNGMSNIKIQSPFVRLDSMEVKNGQTQNGGNGVIVVDPATGVEILNSNIHNNGIVGDVNGQSYGIYAQSPNTIITGNDIHDNTGYGIQIYKSGGNPTNNTFANNRVYNNGCTTNIGAVLIQGTSHKVYNNLIYNNCGRPLEAYFSGDEAGTVFYNNTLYGNINADFALFLNNGVTARNNISSNNAGALVANGTGSVTADHNLCSSACGFGSSNVTDTAANTFVNASAGNFHLGPNAFAKDQGVSNLGSPYNVDFDGLPRTSPWDIGAYEFVASGPSPVVTIVNPTSNPTLGVSSPIFSLGGTSNLP